MGGSLRGSPNFQNSGGSPPEWGGIHLWLLPILGGSQECIRGATPPMGATHPETLLAISKGKYYKNFGPLRAQRNIDFKGQIDVFDYFCAKREENLSLCVFLRVNRELFAREARG